MTVIKYDVTESDPEEAMSGGSSEPPKPGVYACKVKEIEAGVGETSKKPNVKVVFEIAEGTHRGYPLFAYYTFGEGFPIRKWDQFLQVMGIATTGKRKGQFKDSDVIGKPCQIRVKSDKDEDGNYKPAVGPCLPPKDADEGSEEEGDEEITLDEGDSEADEEIDVTDEPVNDEGVGESNKDDLWTTAQIKSMGLDQLKQILLNEYEDETAYKKLETAQKALLKLQATWVAEQGLDDPDELAHGEPEADEGDDEIVIEDEGDGDEDEIVIEEEDYLTEEGLLELDPQELVRIAKEDFELKPKGKVTKSSLIAAILKAQAAPPF